MVNCPHCRKDFNTVQDQRYCPFCGEPLDQAYLQGDDATPPDVPVQEHLGDREPPKVFSSVTDRYCPWEDQENLGFFKGITETLKQSLFSPQTFFSRCPDVGGLVVPLLYALIVKTTGSLVSFLWLFSTDHPFLAKIDLSGNVTLLVGLMIPVGLFLSVIVEAAAVHLALFAIGSARKNFEATFRVVCYGSGPELLDVIPMIGGWAGIAWKTYLIIVGLREVHDITTARAMLAIVLPTMICLGMIGMSFALLARSAGLS